MTRRPAKFTQADIGRAVKAAIAAGATAVVLQPDGTIRIELKPSESPKEPNPWDEEYDSSIVL